MGIGVFLQHTKNVARKKKKALVHNVKNVGRYGRVYISLALSLVIVGSIAGIISGVLIEINEEERKKDLIQYVVGTAPSTLNWVIEFNNASATPASRLMSGLLRPRSKALDNIRKIKTWLDSPNRENIQFTVGGRSFDLSREGDVQYLQALVDQQADYLPSDLPETFGMLGYPKLQIKNKDGGKYDAPSSIEKNFTYDVAKSLTIYEPDEYEFTNGERNTAGRVYEFELRDNAVWNDGRPVEGADFLYQVKMLLERSDKTLKIKSGTDDKNQLALYVDKPISNLESFGIWDLVSEPATAEGAQANASKDAEEEDTLVEAFNKKKTAYDTAFSDFDENDDGKVADLKAKYAALRESMNALISQAKRYDSDLAILDKFSTLFKHDSLISEMTQTQKTEVQNLVTSLETKISEFKTEVGTIETDVKKLVQDKYTTTNMEIADDQYTSAKVTARNTVITEFVTDLTNLQGKTITPAKKTAVINALKEFKKDKNAFGATYAGESDRLTTYVDAYKSSFTDAEGKLYIIHDILNLPLTLFPLVVDDSVTDKKDVKVGKNAFVVPWVEYKAENIMQNCGNGDYDPAETKWNGYDLKFFDGSKAKFYENMGELCDSYATFSTKNNKVTLKFSKGFDVIWALEILGSTILFMPSRKDFMESLARKQGEAKGDSLDHIIGTEYFARDPDSYMGNGPFVGVEFGKTFKMRRNENWHLKEYVIPDTYTLRYVAEAAKNAVTLNYIRGTIGSTTISNDWYKEFKKSPELADEISFLKTGEKVTRNWVLNMFAPSLTNNYFRTPIGSQISWSLEEDTAYPNKTTVKEYKLVDGVRCEVKDTNLYYPSLSLDNFICALPPKFKDYANAVRRLVATSYDGGKAIAFRGSDGKPDRYTFAAETLTVPGLSYDSKSEEYSKTVAVALKYQQENPVAIDDSSYDDAFTDATGTTVTGDQRKEVSFYGSTNYDSNSWRWKSTSKIGFTLLTRENEDPSADLEAPDPVTGEMTKVGYTPSYSYAKAKQMWQNIKSEFPEYSSKSLSLFLPTYQATHFYTLSVKDYWAINIDSITDGKIKLNVVSYDNYFDSSTPYGKRNGLKCGADDLTVAYPLTDDNGNPSLNCLRNPAIYYVGWGYDYSDPKNFLSIFGGSYNQIGYRNSQITRPILQYWKNNINAIIDQDEANGVITAAEKTRFKTEVNEHLDALIRPGAKQTFGDSMSGSPIYDANGDKVADLDSMSGYARNKIIAQLEAWRLREGFSVPMLTGGRAPQASRLVNTVYFGGITYRDNAYNCDATPAERTLTRAYVTAAGDKKQYEFVAPNCLDSKVIAYLSASDEVVGN